MALENSARETKSTSNPNLWYWRVDSSKGIKEIYIGVGGTASNDGGIGIAAGLGYQFYDRDGNVLPAFGQSLLDLASVSTKNRYEIP